MLSRSLGNGVSFVVTMKVADGSGAEHSPRTPALHARGGQLVRPDRFFYSRWMAGPADATRNEGKAEPGDRTAQLRTERDAAAGDCDRGRDGRPPGKLGIQGRTRAAAVRAGAPRPVAPAHAAGHPACQP